MNIEIEIKKTALDYIEGWYEGNVKRMERALHPELIKRRFVTQDEIWTVTYKWMINATREGKGCIDNPKKGKKDITILDMNGKVASVKIISEKYIDYLHLVKSNDKWKIFNVLWNLIGEENGVND